MAIVTLTSLVLCFCIQLNFDVVRCRSINENKLIEIHDIKSDVDKVLYVIDDDGNKVSLITPNDYVRNIRPLLTTDFESTTSFMLYTKAHSDQYELLLVDDKEALLKSSFNPEFPTRVITHGWTSSNTSKSCTLIRDAYLEQGNYNIIIFDWSRYSKLSYFEALQYVKALAGHISRMISFLVSNQLDPDFLNLIGHSLGAHIVGIAGYLSDVQIHQIVGLDPAMPMFGNAGPGSRISVMDAKHIEIIHTNGGVLGFDKPIGHFDFYPNGGESQLGCDDENENCSHSRAVEYFAESIRSPTGFYAYKCDSFEDFKNKKCIDKPVLMGHRYSLPSNGTYYLETNNKYPFAKGLNFQ